MRDQDFIKIAFKLARKGKGLVSPNPVVGTVIVKNGKIIGGGYHKKYGGNHAEVNAIKNSKKEIAGSTLYCNLEPCSHTNKQTPPCVPLIIQKKIKRVVISNLDPNDQVNGDGVRQLRKAGIVVDTGVLEEEGKNLNKFYFKYASENLPYITLKIAQSIDGNISEAKNKQTWLTGNESAKYVHKLRSDYDAVLVGAGTIKSDDPQLNAREIKGRNPIRIIIDGKLSIPLKSKILNSTDPEKTWMFTSHSSNAKKVKMIVERGINIFRIRESAQNLLDIKKILKVLVEHKITSLLVEGGAGIFTQFMEKDLFDEIIILQSPKILGRGIKSSNIKKMKNLRLLSVEKLGSDIKMVYGKKLSD